MFAAWLTSSRPPGTDQLSLRGPKVNTLIWLCAVDDSTINIVPSLPQPFGWHNQAHLCGWQGSECVMVGPHIYAMIPSHRFQR